MNMQLVFISHRSRTRRMSTTSTASSQSLTLWRKTNHNNSRWSLRSSANAVHQANRSTGLLHSPNQRTFATPISVPRPSTTTVPSGRRSTRIHMSTLCTSSDQPNASASASNSTKSTVAKQQRSNGDLNETAKQQQAPHIPPVQLSPLTPSNQGHAHDQLSPPESTISPTSFPSPSPSPSSPPASPPLRHHQHQQQHTPQFHPSFFPPYHPHHYMSVYPHQYPYPPPNPHQPSHAMSHAMSAASQSHAIPHAYNPHLSPISTPSSYHFNQHVPYHPQQHEQQQQSPPPRHPRQSKTHSHRKSHKSRKNLQQAQNIQQQQQSTPQYHQQYHQINHWPNPLQTSPSQYPHPYPYYNPLPPSHFQHPNPHITPQRLFSSPESDIHSSSAAHHSASAQQRAATRSKHTVGPSQIPSSPRSSRTKGNHLPSTPAHSSKSASPATTPPPVLSAKSKRAPSPPHHSQVPQSPLTHQIKQIRRSKHAQTHTEAPQTKSNTVEDQRHHSPSTHDTKQTRRSHLPQGPTNVTSVRRHIIEEPLQQSSPPPSTYETKQVHRSNISYGPAETSSSNLRTVEYVSRVQREPSATSHNKYVNAPPQQSKYSRLRSITSQQSGHSKISGVPVRPRASASVSLSHQHSVTATSTPPKLNVKGQRRREDSDVNTDQKFDDRMITPKVAGQGPIPPPPPTTSMNTHGQTTSTTSMTLPASIAGSDSSTIVVYDKAHPEIRFNAPPVKGNGNKTNGASRVDTRSKDDKPQSPTPDHPVTDDFESEICESDLAPTTRPSDRDLAFLHDMFPTSAKNQVIHDASARALHFTRRMTEPSAGSSSTGRRAKTFSTLRQRRASVHPKPAATPEQADDEITCTQCKRPETAEEIQKLGSIRSNMSSLSIFSRRKWIGPASSPSNAAESPVEQGRMNKESIGSQLHVCQQCRGENDENTNETSGMSKGGAVTVSTRSDRRVHSRHSRRASDRTSPNR